jgi:hypothetical protein
LNEDAIPDLVFSKLKHTEALNVVANLINSPETGWLHYHVGAVHAYLPEWDPPPPDVDGASYGPKAWRASALPQWNSTTASKKANESDFMGPHPAPPPFDGHRWLPLPKDEVNLYRTPIADAKYDPFGDDWTSWAIAAQVQYSLLENIENDQLSRYWYGHGDNRREGIWNMAYERMNINVMVIWGKDVVDNLPFEGRDDEYELSITLPRKLRRRELSSPEWRLDVTPADVLESSPGEHTCYSWPSGLWSAKGYISDRSFEPLSCVRQ